MRRFSGVFFWAASAVLVAFIVYGVSTSGLKLTRPWLVYPEDRLLATAPAKGVTAELRVAGLEREPTLVVKTRGLDERAPLRLWLTEPTRGRAVPLHEGLEVEARGRVDRRVKLPEGALLNYREVRGTQRGKTVFRAPLS